jgi:hypothetical protein
VPDPRQDDSGDSDWDLHGHSHSSAHHFRRVLLVLYLVNMLPVDGRTKQIVRVIVIIIGVLSLLSYLVNF